MYYDCTIIGECCGLVGQASLKPGLTVMQIEIQTQSMLHTYRLAAMII